MENKGTSRFDTGALGRQDAGRMEGESTSSVVDKAKEMGSQAVEKAKDLGAQALERARDVRHQAGEQISRLGERVGETYQAGRHYVTERGIRGMGEDVTDLIRRNPLPALLVGLGIGFLIARAFRKDS